LRSGTERKSLFSFLNSLLPEKNSLLFLAQFRRVIGKYRGNPRAYAAEQEQFTPQNCEIIAVIGRSRQKPTEIREIAEISQETRPTNSFRERGKFAVWGALDSNGVRKAGGMAA